MFKSLELFLHLQNGYLSLSQLSHPQKHCGSQRFRPISAETASTQASRDADTLIRGGSTPPKKKKRAKGPLKNAKSMVVCVFFRNFASRKQGLLRPRQQSPIPTRYRYEPKGMRVAP